MLSRLSKLLGFSRETDDNCPSRLRRGVFTMKTDKQLLDEHRREMIKHVKPAKRYVDIRDFKNDIIRQLDSLEATNPEKFKWILVGSLTSKQVKERLSYIVAKQLRSRCPQKICFTGPTSDSGSVTSAMNGIAAQLSIPLSTLLASLPVERQAFTVAYFNNLYASPVAVVGNDTTRDAIMHTRQTVVSTVHTAANADTSPLRPNTLNQLPDYDQLNLNGERRDLEPPTFIDLTEGEQTMPTVSASVGEVVQPVLMSRPAPFSTLEKRLQLISISLPCIHDDTISVHLHGNLIQVCETTSYIQVSGLVKFLCGPEAHASSTQYKKAFKELMSDIPSKYVVKSGNGRAEIPTDIARLWAESHGISLLIDVLEELTDPDCEKRAIMRESLVCSCGKSLVMDGSKGIVSSHRAHLAGEQPPYERTLSYLVCWEHEIAFSTEERYEQHILDYHMGEGLLQA